MEVRTIDVITSSRRQDKTPWRLSLLLSLVRGIDGVKVPLGTRIIRDIVARDPVLKSPGGRLFK